MSGTMLRGGTCALALSLFALLSACSSGGRLADRAGRAAEREAGRRVVDRGVAAAADAVEDAVTGEADEQPGAAASPGGSPAGQGRGDEPRQEAPRGGQGANVNWDYERGDRPILLEDYSRDNLGDFPRNLELLNGNWDVVDWEGRRFLRGTGGRFSSFQVPLPETLPERFTVEFDVMFTQGNQTIVMGFEPVERAWNSYEATLVKVRNIETGLVMPREGRQFVARLVRAVEPLDTPTPIKVMVDGNHVKVYARDERVANVPNATMRRSDRLHFMDVYSSTLENPIYFGSIRVDAGGRDLYGELEREGRVALEGIYFDTDSDRLRPESNATLEQVAELLRQHPDLRLSIEGHTDSQGAVDYNLQLSDRRAAAVRRHLVEQMGIDGARLQSVGRGASQPVASNDTEEGRQRNRRVELVRME